MYNRYIPQNDGSFRRCHIPDPPTSKPEPPEENTCPPVPDCPPPPQKPEHNRNRRNSQPQKQRPREKRCEDCAIKKEESVGSFLKHLLPKDFDTGDLLVVLLLLLMAGDCHEDQNSALLTLVLYLLL